MKKKSSLPKPFQKMLRQLGKLDDELGISLSFLKPDKKEIQERKKRETRKKLLDKIWENWPRKTLLNKDVLQMRSNALKNPEIKVFLNKSHTRIEDCALVKTGNERNIGRRDDCPAYCSPERIESYLTEWNWGNSWRLHLDYFWGGPKDPVKILFEKSRNNRFKVVGVIQMFA